MSNQGIHVNVEDNSSSSGFNQNSSSFIGRTLGDVAGKTVPDVNKHLSSQDSYTKHIQTDPLTDPTNYSATSGMVRSNSIQPNDADLEAFTNTNLLQKPLINNDEDIEVLEMERRLLILNLQIAKRKQHIHTSIDERKTSGPISSTHLYTQANTTNPTAVPRALTGTMPLIIFPTDFPRLPKCPTNSALREYQRSMQLYVISVGAERYLKNNLHTVVAELIIIYSTVAPAVVHENASRTSHALWAILCRSIGNQHVSMVKAIRSANGEEASTECYYLFNQLDPTFFSVSQAYVTSLYTDLINAKYVSGTDPSILRDEMVRIDDELIAVNHISPENTLAARYISKFSDVILTDMQLNGGKEYKNIDEAYRAVKEYMTRMAYRTKTQSKSGFGTVSGSLSFIGVTTDNSPKPKPGNKFKTKGKGHGTHSHGTNSNGHPAKPRGSSNCHRCGEAGHTVSKCPETNAINNTQTHILGAANFVSDTGNTYSDANDYADIILDYTGVSSVVSTVGDSSTTTKCTIDKDVALVMYEQGDEIVYYDYLYSAEELGSLHTVWVLDSGATRHICIDKSLMHNIKKCQPFRMYTANKQTIDIKEIGSVLLCPVQKIELSNVVALTTCARNLFSVASALDYGCSIVWTKTKATITGPGSRPFKLTFKRIGKLFCIDINDEEIGPNEVNATMRQISRPAEQPRTLVPGIIGTDSRRELENARKVRSTATTSNKDAADEKSNGHSSSSSSHSRLPIPRKQVSYTGARPMTSLSSTSTGAFAGCTFEESSLLIEDRELVLNVGSEVGTYLSHARSGHKGVFAGCQHCIKGSSRRAPIKHKPKPEQYRATKALQCLHVDIVGPMSVVVDKTRIHAYTINKNLYALIVIDEWSRYMWTVPLSTKSEATDHLIDLITRLEKGIGKQVISVHSDGGGEFTCTALTQFYSQRGITQTFTTPYSPARNGLVERHNGLLFNMVRSVLFGAGMGYSYWGEALQYCTFTKNRIASVTTGKIPFTELHNLQFKISKLRPFGCNVSVVIPADAHKRGSLDSITVPGIMLGYSTVQQNAYRILVCTGKTNTIGSSTNSYKLMITHDGIFDEEVFTLASTMKNRALKNESSIEFHHDITSEQYSDDESDISDDGKYTHDEDNQRYTTTGSDSDGTKGTDTDDEAVINTGMHGRLSSIGVGHTHDAVTMPFSTGRPLGNSARVVNLPAVTSPSNAYTNSDNGDSNGDSETELTVTTDAIDNNNAGSEIKEQLDDYGNTNNTASSGTDGGSTDGSTDEQNVDSDTSITTAQSMIKVHGRKAEAITSTGQSKAAVAIANYKVSPAVGSRIRLPRAMKGITHDYESKLKEGIIGNRRIKSVRNFTQLVAHCAGVSPSDSLAGPVYCDSVMVAVGEVDHIEDDTLTYHRAITGKFKEQWIAAMDSEMASLTKLKVAQIVPRPSDVVPIKSKWVYKVKYDAERKPIRFKARIVAKGFEQEYGVNYSETYAPVAKFKSIKLLLVMVVEFNLELHQLDFDVAFLNAELKELVYMAQPQGYHQGATNNVMLLRRALYGLRQSPHEWNANINNFMVQHKYIPAPADRCIYVKQSATGNVIVLMLYVDDTVVAYDKCDTAEWLTDKLAISDTYSIKDLGVCEWVLNMQVIRDRGAGSIKLSQASYVSTLLDRYGMVDCKIAVNPCSHDSGLPYGEALLPLGVTEHSMFRSMVGGLLYVATMTRIDICYAVNLLCRVVSAPLQHHMVAAKRVLRYLAGTHEKCLVYYNSAVNPIYYCKHTPAFMNLDYNFVAAATLVAFSDASWANSPTRKSVSGYICFLFGNAITWSSKLQKTVALSSAESEYIAISNAACEILWLQQWIFTVLKLTDTSAIISDAQSAIDLVHKDAHHQQTKHIDIRYHHVRDHVLKGNVVINWCNGVDQPADILTKSVADPHFKMLTQLLLGA